MTMDESRGHILLSRSDYEGASRGQAAMVVTATLTGISILIVAMRMYTRIGLLKLSGREDWTILASLVFAVIYLGLVISQYQSGLGRHQDSIPDSELKKQLKSLWVAIPMYNASLALTKASLLFQYLRIFPDRRFRIVCRVVMGVVALYTTWAIVSGFVNCVPVAKFWDREIPGTCLSFESLWFFNAAMNIATDLTLLILPMPFISQLHLPLRQRIALVGVFALGGLVVITSILRLSSLRTVAKSTDTSWNNVGAAYWTAAECNVAIICACLPFLRPLISRIFPKFLSTNSYNRNRTNGNPTRSTAARSTRRSTRFTVPDPHLFSRDAEIGLATIDTDVGVGNGLGTKITKMGDAKISGIEVTNEVIQEVSASVSHEGYSIGPQSSQTRLVLDDR